MRQIIAAKSFKRGLEDRFQRFQRFKVSKIVIRSLLSLKL